jgi:hypothetical protein
MYDSTSQSNLKKVASKIVHVVGIVFFNKTIILEKPVVALFAIVNEHLRNTNQVLTDESAPAYLRALIALSGR